MSDRKHVDEVTGIETTGHVWDDDLRELNKPLPKWWVYVLYASILWSIGYWIVYPAWPLATDYTRGIWGYSQRQVVADQVAAAKAAQGDLRKAIGEAELSAIKSDQRLLNFAMAGGNAAFGDNCAPCHGRGAQGFKGYPNLNDDDWIWGGTLDEIHATIAHGIRNSDENSRQNAMPRFGLDQILTREEINDVTSHVIALSGGTADAASAGRGETIYADQCASCHGEKGEGSRELGAPRLNDAIWLYGDAREDIVQSIVTGRGGVMPAWNTRLDDVTVKQLAIYVHSLGGGE
ncbi:MAG: cytochrome-c oxidase, cbb3-type subunit III [Rhizobiales bacterium]|nr:cytochrome-c oxidase, cbb3-type subunit III [Hyphomicrobiales bacterium]